jgi:hypothetical protein
MELGTALGTELCTNFGSVLGIDEILEVELILGPSLELAVKLGPVLGIEVVLGA